MLTNEEKILLEVLNNVKELKETDYYHTEMTESDDGITRNYLSKITTKSLLRKSEIEKAMKTASDKNYFTPMFQTSNIEEIGLYELTDAGIKKIEELELKEN